MTKHLSLILLTVVCAAPGLSAVTRITPEAKRRALLESTEKVFPAATPLDDGQLASISNPFDPNRAVVAATDSQDPKNKEAVDEAFLKSVMEGYRPRGIMTRGTRVAFNTAEGNLVFPGGSFKIKVPGRPDLVVKLESLTSDSYTVSYGTAKLTKPFNETRTTNQAPKP